MTFSQTMRNLQRIKQIANVLLRHQMGYAVDRLNIRSALSFRDKFHPADQPKAGIPERLRLSMDELGGTFVKLGQLLSLRYDMLPKEYCDEFSKLQEGATPFAFSQVKQIIEKELGKPINQVFKEFDQQPIAAASIGQVHKAILRDGTKVAVKVQRPNITAIFEADIDLLFNLARMTDKRFPELREYNPVGIVQEFERYTKRELDYLIEAKNIEIFHDNFKDDKTIVIPKVHWECTTSRVLTMQFIDGCRISEMQKFSKMHADKEHIVKNVVNAFMKQVLEIGVFHADPHPGNLFVVRDSVVAMLDFGIVGKLTPELRDKIGDMLIAVVRKDVEMLVESIVEIGIVSDDVDLKEFKEDLIDRLGDYYGTSLSQLNTFNFFFDALAVARKYKMKFPTAYVLLIKAIVTTQGFVNKLAPEFNFVEECRPAVERIMAKKARPAYVLDSIKRNARSLRYIVTEFPKDLSSLVRTLRKGPVINLDIDNRDIKKLSHELDSSSNRITFGMIIAALVMASALFTLAKLEPMWHNMPVAAIISMAAALLVAFFLVISILREQKGGEYQ